MNTIATNRVGRSIYKTVAHATIVDENNSLIPRDFEFLGNISFESVQRKIKKLLHSTRFIIDSIDYERAYYSMTLEKFIANADITNEESNTLVDSTIQED